MTEDFEYNFLIKKNMLELLNDTVYAQGQAHTYGGLKIWWTMRNYLDDLTQRNSNKDLFESELVPEIYINEEQLGLYSTAKRYFRKQKIEKLLN